jgi:molybdate transport system substrate-binding protein
MNLSSLTVFFFLFIMLPGAVKADEPLTVAVAANALRPAQEIARAFEAKEKIKLRMVSGSTGKLYAQIVQGAPFHVFLAADTIRPALLEEKGLTSDKRDKSRFTYALGTLALWSSRSDIPLEGLAFLNDKSVGRIAVANPKTAPYGQAALEVLEKSSLMSSVRDKLVFGESVSQAFGFARSGNADVAIVALSTVYGMEGTHAKVDESLYSPIVQQGVVLSGAPMSALKFIDFLLGPEGQAVFKKYGYGTENPTALKISSEGEKIVR